MKTRLIVIAVMFVIINLIFYVGFEGSEDSQEDQEIEQESIDTEKIEEEPMFAKFNPPEP